jgi:hypothetical protein
VATGGPSNPNTNPCFPGCGGTVNSTDGCDRTANSTLPPALRTYNRQSAPFSAADMYQHNPWRADPRAVES